jgi:hypothetical protein
MRKVFQPDRLANHLLPSSEKVCRSATPRAMNRSFPNCDRHTNLQMVPCWLQRENRVVAGHVCPVPGCGRYHAEGNYLEAKDVELVLGPKASELKRAIKKSNPEPTPSPKPLNRQEAARAAILRAIEQKQRQ